jgi:uncharacterized protein (UPF0332 family)
MDAQRQQTLWAIALENYQAAVLMAQQGWHNVRVACSYYSVFTAMWVALGDPLRRRWEHAGIVEHFAPGQCRTPPSPIERELTRAIRRLYADRLAANYRAVRLTSLESTASLTTARHVLHLVSGVYGLSQGGIIL